MAYFLCMVCDLIFVWLIVGSKATLFLGSDYSEQVLKALWDSFSSLCLIIAFFVTVADFVVALWFYVYAYITRSFSKYKAYVGLVTSSAGLGMGVMVITLSFVVNDKLDYFPWFMVVAIAMVCAVNIFADIKYIKAAGSESSATLELTGTALKLSKISSESVGLRDDYWECPECGTRNSKLSNQCKDCGKYR